MNSRKLVWHSGGRHCSTPQDSCGSSWKAKIWTKGPQHSIVHPKEEEFWRGRGLPDHELFALIAGFTIPDHLPSEKIITSLQRGALLHSLLAPMRIGDRSRCRCAKPCRRFKTFSERHAVLCASGSATIRQAEASGCRTYEHTEGHSAFLLGSQSRHVGYSGLSKNIGAREAMDHRASADFRGFHFFLPASG